MAKYVFPILLIFVLLNTGYSQSDTIAFSKEKNQSEEDQYDTLYKQFVKEQVQEIRHLWKINLVDLAILMPNLDFEQKLGKLWSSESYLKLGITIRDDYKGVFSPWEVCQQFKLYYNLNRRERHGKKTNGFSGNYLSLNLFAGEHNYPKPGFRNTTLIDAVSYYGTGLHYGLQRRIGNTGYFELFAGIRCRYQKLSQYTDRVPFFDFSNSGSAGGWGFDKVFGVKAGFAIGSFSNPIKLSRGNDQTGEAKRIWKLNLLGYGPFRPNCGFEFRIGKNWSSDSYLQLGVDEGPSRQSSFSLDDIGGYTSLEIEFEQQLRYYLNVTGREKQGHKTSGFSGDYFSGSLFAGSKGYNYDYEDPDLSFAIHVYTQYTAYGAGLKYGLQRRIAPGGRTA